MRARAAQKKEEITCSTISIRTNARLCRIRWFGFEVPSKIHPDKTRAGTRLYRALTAPFYAEMGGQVADDRELHDFADDNMSC